MEEARNQSYLANLALLAELSQQQNDIELQSNISAEQKDGENSSSLNIHKQATSSSDSYLDKKVKDLTKSLQTMAESCQLAAAAAEEKVVNLEEHTKDVSISDAIKASSDDEQQKAQKKECTIIDAFASLTQVQHQYSADGSTEITKMKLEILLDEKIKKRSTQNAQLPIAYNTSMVSALVKQSQQSSQLAFYEHFV